MSRKGRMQHEGWYIMKLRIYTSQSERVQQSEHQQKLPWSADVVRSWVWQWSGSEVLCVKKCLYK